MDAHRASKFRESFMKSSIEVPWTFLNLNKLLWTSIYFHESYMKVSWTGMKLPWSFHGTSMDAHQKHLVRWRSTPASSGNYGIVLFEGSLSTDDDSPPVDAELISGAIPSTPTTLFQIYAITVGLLRPAESNPPRNRPISSNGSIRERRIYVYFFVSPILTWR